MAYESYPHNERLALLQNRMNLLKTKSAEIEGRKRALDAINKELLSELEIAHAEFNTIKLLYGETT